MLIEMGGESRLGLLKRRKRGTRFLATGRVMANRFFQYGEQVGPERAFLRAVHRMRGLRYRMRFFPYRIDDKTREF
jgi:hypothetical protein